MIALLRTAGLAAILAAAPTTVLAQRLGAGGTGIDNNTALPHCATPLGTIALVEKKADDPMDKLSEGLPALAAMAAQQNGNSVNRVDPIPLVRLMASTSGCFRVAERGEAYEALKRERQMAGIPETVRMVAADYVLNVQLLYSDANSRGGGGGLGGSFGSAIGLKTKALESQILLTMLDVKTGLQTAIATGSARKKDLTVVGGGLLIDAGVGALGGTYANTDIGKVTALATLDAFRKFIPVAQAQIAPNPSANQPTTQPAHIESQHPR